MCCPGKKEKRKLRQPGKRKTTNISCGIPPVPKDAIAVSSTCHYEGKICAAQGRRRKGSCGNRGRGRPLISRVVSRLCPNVLRATSLGKQRQQRGVIIVICTG